MTRDHRVAPINLEIKALVGELCRLGGEIRQNTAKKSKTRTNRTHVPESQVTCKVTQLTRMVVDAMLNINNTIGRQVDIMIGVIHYMSGYVRILCTLKYRSSDNYKVRVPLMDATACA